jgi:DNA invertase Pin-like site-specific DNA recombinase
MVLPTAYDDGGYSGASMQRPALQQLLADIEAGRIDVVVVYKVDRLTRALSDFAKLVEIFDRCGVSFISITQQFNTTTSMGRLTLNILLSFAQFERELIGERVRDKIAASKKKGIWMGGTVPLGYEVKDRKLVVNKAEARTVVDIYRRYLNLKSVRMAQNVATEGSRRGRFTSCCRTGPTEAKQHTKATPTPESIRRSLTSHSGMPCRLCSPKTAWHGRMAPTARRQAY